MSENKEITFVENPEYLALDHELFQEFLRENKFTYFKAWEPRVHQVAYYLETTVSSQVLVAEFQTSRRESAISFLNLYIANGGQNAFSELLGSMMVAAVSNNQFSQISYHHGTRLFTVRKE